MATLDTLSCIEPVKTEEQCKICLDVIRKSFSTVAAEFHITVENCPTYTAFLPFEKLKQKWDNGSVCFLYRLGNIYVGCFALTPDGSSDVIELEHLAVLPAYRHQNVGGNMLHFAAQYASRQYQASKIKIGILYENTVLEKWHASHGFVLTATKSYPYLPFSVGLMEKELKRNGDN